MSSKIKNVSLLIISIIIFTLIILWCKQTLALAPGQTVTLTANSSRLTGDPDKDQFNLASFGTNFYCIQEGQPLDHDTKFTVSKVGKNGFAHFQVSPSSYSKENYVMAWIASQENVVNGKKQNSQPENSIYSTKQKAIYGYFSTWAKAYGDGWDKITVNSGGHTSSWISDAEEDYAQWLKVKDGISIRNNKSDINNIKKESYTYEGQSYIKVGPFNFSYTGANPVAQFEVTNQNGTKMSPLYGFYEGNTLKISSSFHAEKYSGKDFYIFVSTSTNATEINLKVNLTDKRWDYDCYVYLLESDTYKEIGGVDKKTQNVISLTATHTQKTLTDSIQMNNIPLIGNLEITKKDKDTGALLNNVGFVLYNTQTKQYVASASSNGMATYTSNRNQAKEFITGVDGSNGKITVKGLVLGTYEIYETKNPNYGYAPITSDKKIATVNVGSSSATYTANNEKTIGDLEIIKRDQDSSALLNNVGFIIYNVDKQQYVESASSTQTTLATYTSDRNRAKEFVTGVDGETGKIFIRGLEYGNYRIYETSNSNYGYDSSATVGENTTTIQFSSEQDSFTINNRRMYFKLSGYVWEDIAWEIGKTEFANELYQAVNDDKNDKLLSNIVVKLKDNQGNTVKETTTNANGKYTFTDVLIDNLDEYYIEFSYNGMAYESVELIDITNPRGTEAIEGGNRTTFNEKFAQITTGQSNNISGTKTNDINYNTEDYKSTIDYEGNYLYGYSDALIEEVAPYTGITVEDYKTYYPVNGVADKYVISSTTYNAYKSVGQSGYLSDIISADSIRKNGITEIGATFTDGINLGLKKRERPDLSVVKDVESAKVSIVGTQHVYKYGDRFNEELWAENSNGVSGHDLDPQVKFEEKYAEMTYSRPIYASDVYYDGTDDEEIRVEMTYKISVKNNSTNLGASIYELDDYFDSKYNLVAIGTDINADGSIMQGTEITEYTDVTEVNSEYKKVTIGGNNRAILELEPLQEKFVYVVLEVNKGNIIDIVESEDNEYAKLDNISEIKTYGVTKVNDNGQAEVYAGIDKDSQPGNTDVNDRTTWEDDTDKAPGMLLILTEEPGEPDEPGIERQVNGKVFLDTDVNSVDEGKRVHTGVARQGNGQFDDGEQGIKNVKVTLVDSEGNIAQVYNEDTRQLEEAVTYTNDNGEYTFNGFIPGEYQIQYTWGGNIDGSGIDSTYTLDNGDEQIVNVQNYKSTIVNETVWNAKGTEDKWYHDSFKQNYPGLEWNTDTNTEIRASDAVDDYDTRLAIDSEIGDMTYGEKQKLENTYDESSTGDKYTNTQMNSSTQNFNVYIEYEDTENLEDNITDQNIEEVNTVNSIDFGIIERARQLLELDKNITGVKITLANSNVLINAKLVDGVLQGQTQYVTVMPPSNANNGQIKVEIDQEVIQGATLNVEYGLKVTNSSELDYQTQEFYMYGVGHGENESAMVTLQPSLIIDYIDSNMLIDDSDPNSWTAVAQEDRADYLYDENSNPDGLLSENLEDTLNSSIRVITTEQLKDNVLKPIGNENETSITAVLNAQRLLSNNDETFLENNAEIIKVTRNNGGSVLITTPGNYVPSDSSTSEEDDSVSESVTIVPPTGTTTNTISYVIIAISSLAIIIAGIILIKRFVLK